MIPKLNEFQEVVHCPNKPVDCQSTVAFEHTCYVLIEMKVLHVSWDIKLRGTFYRIDTF